MQEKWKKIVGSRRWWLVNGVIIALVLVAVAIWLPEDSDAAAPVAPATSSTASARIPTCGSLSELECEREWAKKKVRQFKNGKLGNAKGFRLPRRVRRMLDAKQAGRVDAKLIVDDDWWDYPGSLLPTRVT